MKTASLLPRTLAALVFICSLTSSAMAVTLPDPVADEPLRHQGAASEKTEENIVLAGGCFWGMQNLFQHVKGVTKVVSGYAGGKAGAAHYQDVSTGDTGHAESVSVTYDPSQISLGAILKVFFGVAHDPTELNYQGSDHGTQYRSAIFYANDAQKKIAGDYIDQLQKAKLFADPIVTKLESLSEFYPAESYHQNYARLHPDEIYILLYDAPKVAALQKTLPDLYAN